jgi:hypothetical protein
MRLNISQLNRVKTYGRPPRVRRTKAKVAGVVVTDKASYAVYLQSEHWLKRRRKKLRGVKRCQIKGCEGVRLEVHHQSYENLGHEPDRDLVVVCRSCHELIHRIQKTQGVSLRQATFLARSSY